MHSRGTVQRYVRTHTSTAAGSAQQRTIIKFRNKYVIAAAIVRLHVY